MPSFLQEFLDLTVSQSQELSSDLSLFRMGVLQRYWNDDRNITLLGILTIALTFASSLFVELLSESRFSSIRWVTLVCQLGKAFFTGIVITLLFHTFFIVADYYLERGRDVSERNIAATILHEDYQQFHHEQLDPPR